MHHDNGQVGYRSLDRLEGRLAASSRRNRRTPASRRFAEPARSSSTTSGEPQDAAWRPPRPRHHFPVGPWCAAIDPSKHTGVETGVRVEPGQGGDLEGRRRAAAGLGLGRGESPRVPGPPQRAHAVRRQEDDAEPADHGQSRGGARRTIAPMRRRPRRDQDEVAGEDRRVRAERAPRRGRSPGRRRPRSASSPPASCALHSSRGPRPRAARSRSIGRCCSEDGSSRRVARQCA